MYNVYYRTPVENKKPLLRCITADTDDHKEAEQAVMEQLHNNMEVYIKPVLVLIKKGGGGNIERT